VRRSDVITAGVALAVHAGIAVAVVWKGEPEAKPAPRKTLLLEYAKQKEEPPPPPKAEALPEPVRPAVPAPRVRKVAFKPRAQPAPAAAPAPPAAQAPATPRYTVAMSSTDAGSAVAVPAGQPGGTGKAGAGPAGAAGKGDGTGFHPVSAGQVGSMPEVDTEACGRAAIYPRAEERNGTEGDVRLRVALTEKGKVHDVRVLTSLGRPFDAAAIDAIKNRCKFKPAISRDGQPVAFVIQSYTFHFELPR
jgi:TonB family protein